MRTGLRANWTSSAPTPGGDYGPAGSTLCLGGWVSSLGRPGVRLDAWSMGIASSTPARLDSRPLA